MPQDYILVQRCLTHEEPVHQLLACVTVEACYELMQLPGHTILAGQSMSLSQAAFLSCLDIVSAVLTPTLAAEGCAQACTMRVGNIEHWQQQGCQIRSFCSKQSSVLADMPMLVHCTQTTEDRSLRCVSKSWIVWA